MRPVLTIIIPVWNGASCIGTCLEAITAQTNGSREFETIVVDNGSSDGTRDAVLDYPEVILLSEPLPGSYRARNTGLRAAKGEFVLFTDADCVPADGWVAAALECARSSPATAIHAGRVELFRETGSGALSARLEELLAFNQESNVRHGFCVTANWLSPRSVVTDAGGFADHLLSGGDTELSRRLVRSGATLKYAPQMLVRHPTRATLGALMKKRRRVIGGRWTQARSQSKDALRWILTLTNECFDQTKWIVRAPMEVWVKPGVILLNCSLLLVALFEILRLAAGRQAYRS